MSGPSKGGGSDLDAAMALFASNAKNTGQAAGMEETFGKLISGGASPDSAAKAFEGLNNNLQNAMSQLTQPIAGLTNVMSQHGSILGNNVFGETKRLNMNASAAEIAGNSEDGMHGGDVDNGGESGSSTNSGGEDDQLSQANSGDSQAFFNDGENYNPHHPENYSQLEDAGQKIFSGSAPEHHEDIDHSIQPQAPTSSVPQHSGHSVGHD